ncbi:hypothetical protein KY290_018793 [Solanum tuberosum]|uniref:Reverse transcriptase zinc-binding domain-containing protein n=1 Tax=Solanum tuberosum TaxID=4113 RepID=A0ABQ7VF76_SOLTU|nr:hypothetical protein KY290_018793 [Solanum tuberosum]
MHIQCKYSRTWVVQKILEAREWLMQGQPVAGTMQTVFSQVLHGTKFSVHKVYTYLLPQMPRVAWKSLTLQAKGHPRFKFILWLAVQKRLSTVERLLKFGIQVVYLVGVPKAYSRLEFYGALGEYNCKEKVCNGSRHYSSFCNDYHTHLARKEQLQISTWKIEY